MTLNVGGMLSTNTHFHSNPGNLSNDNVCLIMSNEFTGKISLNQHKPTNVATHQW